MRKRIETQNVDIDAYLRNDERLTPDTHKLKQRILEETRTLPQRLNVETVSLTVENKPAKQRLLGWMNLRWPAYAACLLVAVVSARILVPSEPDVIVVDTLSSTASSTTAFATTALSSTELEFQELMLISDDLIFSQLQAGVDSI